MHEHEEAMQRAVMGLSTAASTVMALVEDYDSIDTFKLFDVSISSRNGFRTQRRPWESSNDDPSTYGGYLSRRRKGRKQK